MKGRDYRIAVASQAPGASLLSRVHWGGDDGSKSVEKLIQIEAGDRQLLAGVEDVLAEAARRSGDWLVCRPGCTQCCLGPFAITRLDALRLRNGLNLLNRTDPERAARVRLRAAEYVAAISPHYPGDPATGELLDEDRLA